MARIDSLDILLDPSGKMLLAETYDGVIENVQKATISSSMKNTDLSGDPNAGTVEAKRFANASSQAYGTARTGGAGQKVQGKTVTVPINTDREFVEEIQQKDISLLGVDGLLAKRSANHAQRMAAELDTAFFAEAVAEGTSFTPSAGATTLVDKIEEAVVTMETLKNAYIDGIDRSMMNLVLTPATYSAVRKYLDTSVHNANINTAVEEFISFHGVRCYSSVRMPSGVDFLLLVDSAVAQPVKSTPYSAEKIPMSEAYAVELFFYYGTKAVTPELILYYGAGTGLTVTSVAGTNSGDTKITVEPAKATGNSYKYKTASSVDIPTYGSTVSGYTSWDGSADITATTGNDIVIVELDANSKVVKAGKTTVTSA